jgi:hypothetical protein
LAKPAAVGKDIHIIVGNEISTIGAISNQARGTSLVAANLARVVAIHLSSVASILAQEASNLAKSASNFAK